MPSISQSYHAVSAELSFRLPRAMLRGAESIALGRPKLCSANALIISSLQERIHVSARNQSNGRKKWQVQPPAISPPRPTLQGGRGTISNFHLSWTGSPPLGETASAPCGRMRRSAPTVYDHPPHFAPFASELLKRQHPKTSPNFKENTSSEQKFIFFVPNF